MDTLLSGKELYEVALKATSQIQINGKTYEEGETVIAFENIQIAEFKEIKGQTSANGGYDNADLILWNEPKRIDISIGQGVVSPLQLAMLDNARLTDTQPGQIINAPKTEILETNEDGDLELKYEPIPASLFVYNFETGAREYPELNANILNGLEPFKEYKVEYKFEYNEKASVITIGKELLQSYLQLIGKLRLKDDRTGKTQTGILTIPKCKIVSSLAIRLGKNASPMAQSFQIVGLPIGERKNKTIYKLEILSDDIDSDII
jgi:hypothetical protein